MGPLRSVSNEENRMLGNIKNTSRGFQLIEFSDINGQSCSLQQSSLALYDQPGASAVWLGVGENRMHLNDDMVAALVNVLSVWLHFGNFDKTEPSI